jgi:hypothetical protein
VSNNAKHINTNITQTYAFSGRRLPTVALINICMKCPYDNVLCCAVCSMGALTESTLDRFGFLLPRNEDQVHWNTGEDHETAIA